MKTKNIFIWSGCILTGLPLFSLILLVLHPASILELSRLATMQVNSFDPLFMTRLWSLVILLNWSFLTGLLLLHQYLKNMKELGD